jgi:rhodanese-related sulfurtransferase
VLDIRDSGEYKAGHIPEAYHIPQRELKQRLKELAKFKEKPVIVYCRTGTQSAAAGSLLKKEGFATVRTLNGGITAWQNANLPLRKKK